MRRVASLQVTAGRRPPTDDPGAESEPYHPPMRLSDRGRHILFVGIGMVGYAYLARVLLVNGIEGAGGLGGIDAIAYWTAAGHALHGEPLYAIAGFEFQTYQYPPVFAQVLAPAAMLPMPVFVWLWRGIELVGLRLATGGWARAGIAILIFPPVIAEIDAGNVHLIIAGVTALAMRGIAGPVGPSFLIKFSTWPLAPLAWLHDRRGLLIGSAAGGLVAAVSIALAPGAWNEYLVFLTSHSLPADGYKILYSVPLVVRLVFAALVGLAAVRWIRLAPVAVALPYPIVWFHALSTLAAVVTPLGRRRPDAVAE